MESPTFELILFFISLGLAYNLTTVKIIFPIIHKNFDPERDTSLTLQQIEKFWNKKAIVETTTIARAFYITLSSLALYSLIPFYAPGINSIPLHIFPETVILWISLFIFGIFTPNLLGQIRPYGSASLHLKLFYPTYYLFWIPGQIAHWVYISCLAKLGYDYRLKFLTDEEQKQLDDSNDNGEQDLEPEEKEMIRAIFEFGDIPVNEIMTPRIDVNALEVSSSLEEVSKMINQEKNTRIPVYEGKIDQIIGFLHAKDFIAYLTSNQENKFQLSEIIRPAYFVSHKEMIDDVMKELRNSRNHLAIVLDEFGGIAGIITLEDILEEIVGEIYDEDDAEEIFIETIRQNTFVVNPIIPIETLQKELDISLPEIEGIETLGGFIQSQVQAIPRKGTLVQIGNIKIKVIKIVGQRMIRVLIKKEDNS
jgi:CBS domain containing-hemolysin-like protein